MFRSFGYFLIILFLLGGCHFFNNKSDVCPTGFVFIAENEELGVPAFCVMKFEAKEGELGLQTGLVRDRFIAGIVMGHLLIFFQLKTLAIITIKLKTLAKMVGNKVTMLFWEAMEVPVELRGEVAIAQMEVSREFTLYP